MVVLLLHLWVSVAWSAPPPPASPDVDAVHHLIDDQITAFRAQDAAAAWNVVAPGLQEQFGTPDAFLRMVQRGYRSVAAPRSYRYGALVPLPADEYGPGALGQWLDVVGPDGEKVRALYLLERQPDGTWRTSGCLLFAPGPERTAV